VADSCGILKDNILSESGYQTSALAILQLGATAWAHNLHVHTTLIKLYILVLNRIGGETLLVKLILANNNNRAVGNELCNGITFLFLLIAVGLIVVTTAENSGHGYHDKQYLLHLAFTI
jgi:ABC-type phosphate transport system permease subunit